MKCVICFSLLVLLAFSCTFSQGAVAPDIGMTCTGPADGMIYLYYVYFPPTLRIISDNDSLYFDRNYLVRSFTSGLAGKVVIPTLANEKTTPVDSNWFSFTLNQAYDVYIGFEGGPADLVAQQNISWVGNQGWQAVSGQKLVWDQNGGAWSNDSAMHWYKKNGSSFTFGGQGNTVDPATGSAGAVTFNILVDPAGAADIKFTSFRMGNTPAPAFSAYPNPFTKNVSINVDKAANVQIVDLNGKVVRNLRQDRVWDGNNNRGVKVNAGTYIVQFQIGGKIHSGKVVMNR